MKIRKNYFLVLFLFPAFVIASAKRDFNEKSMEAYLMVYFKDQTHSLHMALSDDGYIFTDVNDGEPVIAGDSIAEQKGIRDPHIFRGPDGAFYLTMTDLHIFAKDEGLRDTEWECDGRQYGWGNNRGLVLMKSNDLINWTRTNMRVDQAFEGLENIGCAWAPQTTYDAKKKKLMLYFTMRFENGLNKLYYANVSDEFTRLETKPELLFTYPKGNVNYIDADITKVGKEYHMFYVSHEEGAGIKQAVSKSVNEGYVYDPKYYDPEGLGCEAPNVWKRIGEERWVLMYDVYRARPNNMGFSETTDFKTFADLGLFNNGVMKTTNFQSPKHGAVIHVTKKEADNLRNYWKEKQ